MTSKRRTGSSSGAATASPNALQLVALDVHPSVVFKLGDDLISDEIQALVELVKNCYDADATFARVTIDTTAEIYANTVRQVGPDSGRPGAPVSDGGDVTDRTGVDAAGALTTSAHLIADAVSDEVLVGSLTVEDNGVGMDPFTIVDGWLVISNSHKRAMKQSGKTTAGRRTPLGDKGLGRLGAQRLGRELEIITRPPDSPMQYRVRIPWHVFDNATRLAQVNFPLIAEEPTFSRGTRLTIHGLSDLDLWNRRRADVTRSLSTLISPFPGHVDLDVSVRVDGLDLDLVQLTDRMRDTAEVRYHAKYTDERLSVHGRAALEFFRPAPDKPADEHADFRRLMERDRGTAFYAWFATRSAPWVEGYRVERTTRGKRTFLEYETDVALGDIGGAAYIGDALADPGPFSGEIDAFALDSGTQSIFDSTATYRDYFRSIAGVRLYRNGFGIRMPEDWLGLGKRWSSGSSYYNLKPSNVVGFIDLTAKDNACLEEMTDREGLRSSPYLVNFMLLMEQWRIFTERVQGRLRRAYLDYRREMTTSDAGVDPQEARTAEEVARELRNRAQVRRKTSKGNTQALAGVTQSLTEASSAAERLRDDQDQLSEAETKQRIAQVEASLRRASAVVTQLSEREEQQDEEARREANLISALQQQLEQVREQLAMSYEAVALGLTAEAWSHEVHQIADRLASRTTQVRSTLKQRDELTPLLAQYLESVRSQANTLNRQMARLNPALRFARERRTQISVLRFLNDVADYFNQRWQASTADRRLIARVDPSSQDFTVTMNQGRLNQVVDNLVLNSEYWLRAQPVAGTQQQRKRRGDSPIPDLPLALEGDGQVLLRCHPRHIIVEDNGPGVATNVEATLFDPFVSAKRSGRGLGLYISQQLLEAEGGRVVLDSKRNMNGRRYRFEVDLEGVAP